MTAEPPSPRRSLECKPHSPSPQPQGSGEEPFSPLFLSKAHLEDEGPWGTLPELSEGLATPAHH